MKWTGRRKPGAQGGISLTTDRSAAMAAVSLRAHYDGERIQLDEPFQIPANSQSIVTVIPKDEALRAWRDDWYQLAAQGLARAYGPDEPEYTEADCIP